MELDKDVQFWNALRKSRRLRSPVLGCLTMALGAVIGAGITWWLYTGPFARETEPGQLDMALGGSLSYGILAAIPFYLFGRRFFTRDAVDALNASDGSIRPYVLYLRAFEADGGLHGWINEPRLGRVLARIGVPVCVGRPGERLPPFGFHRIYFANEDWQESVLAMAEHAKVIVVLIGETAGLKWEIEQLLGWNYLDKTILLVPAHRHDRYREKLESEHGFTIPARFVHYERDVSWRRLDLCPIEFPYAPTPVGRAVVIVPGKSGMWGFPPVYALYQLFRLAIVLLTIVIPWLRRFDWIADDRSLYVNYAATLEPVLKRFDASFSKTLLDRYQ